MPVDDAVAGLRRWSHLADPGNVRLRAAGAAVATAVATTLVAWIVARVAGQLKLSVAAPAGNVTVVSHPTAMLIGGMVAVLMAQIPLPQTPKERRSALIRLPVSFFAGTFIGIALERSRIATLVGLCVLAVVLVLAQRWPQHAGMVMAGFFGTFIAAFVRLTTTQIPWVALLIATSSVVAIALQLTVFAPRPRETLQRLFRALDEAADLLLETLADGLSAGSAMSPERRADVGAAATAVSRIALTIDLHLGNDNNLSTDLRANAHVAAFDREASLLSVTRASIDLINSSASIAARTDASELLRAIRAGAGGGQIHAAQLIEDTRAARQRAVAAGDAASEASASATYRLAVACLDLAESPAALPTDAAGQEYRSVVSSAAGSLMGSARLAADSLVSAAPPGAVGRGFPPAILQRAARMAIAVGAATAVGDVVNSTRWYWAFFGAFAVMMGANTAAEHIRLGLERMLGTAAGVALGVPLAHSLDSVPAVTFGVLFVALGLGIYSQRQSQFFNALAFTVMVGSLYVQLHTYSDNVLLTRVVETAIGAAVAIIVSLLVFRIRRASVVRTASITHVRALSVVVDNAIAHATGRHPSPSLRSDVRVVQDALSQLRAVVAPMSPMSSSRVDEPYRDAVGLLWVLTHDAAELARRASMAPVFAPAQRNDLDVIAADLSAVFDALVDWLEERRADAPTITPSSAIERVDMAIRGDATPGVRRQLAVLHQLSRIEEHLAELGRLNQYLPPLGMVDRNGQLRPA